MRRGASVLPQAPPQLTGNTSPLSIRGETQAYCRGPISAPCLPATNDDPHHIRSLSYYALSEPLGLLWKIRIFHKRLDLRLDRADDKGIPYQGPVGGGTGAGVPNIYSTSPDFGAPGDYVRAGSTHHSDLGLPQSPRAPSRTSARL